jgi:anti-sigma regulatory factor (Ser/Thr protein kinase)
MKLFPDGLIFSENENLIFNPEIKKHFKDLKIIETKDFSIALSELDSNCYGEIAVMKPENILCRTEKQIIDNKDYIYVKNLTKDRQKKVLSSIFMRVIFDKLKNSISNMKKVCPEISENSDFLLEAAMAENLVDQLYYFSSLNSGALRLNTQLINAESLINKTIQKIISLKLAQKDDFNFLISNNLPEIRLDPDKFQDVLTTLICNGITYSSKEAPLEIILSTYKKNFLKFIIKDKGRGIPEEILNKIFDKNYHLDRMINSGDKVNRLSIGLPYLKYIIQAHGGNIIVNSAQNKGTEFIIIMPIDPLQNHIKQKNDFLVTINKKKFLEIKLPAKNGNMGKIEESVSEFLKDFKLSNEDLCSINLVISESVSNSIMHGPKQPEDFIALKIIKEKKGLLISIRDCGGNFFYPSFYEKLAKDRGMKAGGRGIFFMKHFMDEILYVINNKKSTWLFMYKILK